MSMFLMGVLPFLIIGVLFFFTVRSQDDQHPFLLAQRMDTANIPGGTRPGATDMNFPQNLGDEEFVVMLPPAQFLAWVRGAL